MRQPTGGRAATPPERAAPDAFNSYPGAAHPVAYGLLNRATDPEQRLEAWMGAATPATGGVPFGE